MSGQANRRSSPSQAPTLLVLSPVPLAAVSQLDLGARPGKCAGLGSSRTMLASLLAREYCGC